MENKDRKKDLIQILVFCFRELMIHPREGGIMRLRYGKASGKSGRDDLIHFRTIEFPLKFSITPSLICLDVIISTLTATQYRFAENSRSCIDASRFGYENLCLLTMQFKNCTQQALNIRINYNDGRSLEP